jgi:uncharacterized iron-regulated protein
VLATSAIFSTAALACDPIENIESVLSRQVIVLGEIHGTNESPRFAENLVCHLLKAKNRVVLALEISNAYQSQIADAMNQTSEAAAVAQLGKMPFWRPSMQDGKRSIGYMSLLRSAWRWKQQNPEFQVMAVDLPSSNVPVAREEYIAAKLNEAVRDPRMTVVALLGNLHSQRAKGTPWNIDFVPAVSLVTKLDLVSLKMGYSSGTAWVCTRAGCGATSVSNTPPSGKVQTPRITLSTRDPNFDGVYFLGEVTASAPFISGAAQ